MRILIEGAGFVNKGAEAMLRTVQSELGKRLPNASFYVERSMVRPGTEHLAQSAGIGILDRVVPKTFPGRTRLRVREMLRTPFQALDVWRERAGITGWATLLETIDAVIDISGYRYADSWGSAGAQRVAPIVYQMWRTGKPYIFLPQAWGPFENSSLRDVCRKNCLRSTLLIVRDAESRQHVARLLNKRIDEVYQSPDVAFLFRDAGVSFGKEYLTGLGLRLGEYPVVAVSPNLRVYERSEGFGSENAYIKTLVSVCQHFLSQGTGLLLIPHEINPGRAVLDDRWLCELILLALGKSDRVATLSSPATAEVIGALIACCDMMIGSRFHAIVAALRTRVPAVALGWAHKYGELLRDVDLGQFALDYESLDLEELSRVIRMAWEQREASRQVLDAKLPRIESEVARMFDLVAGVVSARSPAARSS